jgi:ArpU family phage transcriptional regulator
MRKMIDTSAHTEQMEWKKVLKCLEKMLYEYPLLKISLENERELEQEGLSNLYPSMTSSYEHRTSKGYSEYQSSTEKYALLRAAKQMKLRQVERALEVLNMEEKAIIEEKYFNPMRHFDSYIYDKLGFSKSTYQRLKKSALKKLAVALNIM